MAFTKNKSLSMSFREETFFGDVVVTDFNGPALGSQLITNVIITTFSRPLLLAAVRARDFLITCDIIVQLTSS